MLTTGGKSIRVFSLHQKATVCLWVTYLRFHARVSHIFARGKVFLESSLRTGRPPCPKPLPITREEPGIDPHESCGHAAFSGCVTNRGLPGAFVVLGTRRNACTWMD